MKYDYFQEEKLKYEDIEIPDELLFMVRQTIAEDRRKKAAKKRARIIKMAGSVAAILFLCLTIGVNSSYAFAETVVKIPVVKSVAKAVIVRSYKADIIALDEKNSKQPEEKPEMEQMPEEIEPAVSDNDVISENEAPQQQQEQKPEEKPEGFDAWKAEMTLEKFKEITELYTPDMEKRYADTPEKLRTILLAELPEKETFLYGYHEDGKMTGVALRVNDTYRYFDWNYMNSTKKLPDLSVADTDGDGEEELIILLYNGEPQMKAITKEDIEAPGESENNEETGNTLSDQSKENAENATEDNTEENIENKQTNKDQETNKNKQADKATGTADAEKTKTSAQEEKTENSTQNVDSKADTKEADEENKNADVSGNDINAPESPKKPLKQQAGELWVVSLKGENWAASVLSVDDYESQIIHQLKAEYDEMTDTVQLYLMEETLGEPVGLSIEEDNLTYDSVNLAAEREFVTEEGLFLYFRMEAVFSDADGEKVIVPLDMKLQAEIHLEDGSLVVENIKER